MTHTEATVACVKVSHAIKDLEDYYAVIVVKCSGRHEVVIRQKGDSAKC